MIAAIGIYVIGVALLICCFFKSAGRNREYDLAEQAAILETLR